VSVNRSAKLPDTPYSIVPLEAIPLLTSNRQKAKQYQGLDHVQLKLKTSAYFLDDSYHYSWYTEPKWRVPKRIVQSLMLTSFTHPCLLFIGEWHFPKET
jgi:hypothetical protein